jgi:hypothetical protein
MNELETLRVSVARIAQKLNLHDHIPGCKTYWPAPYEVLCIAARTEERGWNKLCAMIIEKVERLGAMADAYMDSTESWERPEHLRPEPDDAMEEGCRYERAYGDRYDAGD